MGNEQSNVFYNSMEADMEGFHQVIAVTQGSINVQLKNQHRAYSELRSIESSLLPPETSQAPPAKLTAEMGPMRVEIGTKVDDHLDTSVYCIMTLIKGQFMIHTSHDDSYAPIEIDNWRVAFRVNLNFQPEEMSKIPEHIKKKLGAPGSYSVKKLLLDFTNVNASDFHDRLSHLPVDLTPGQKSEQLLTILSRWAKNLVESRSIFGYSVARANSQTSSAPTFMPTSVTHQCYPFSATKVYETVAKLMGPDHDVNDNNTLLFLEMTRNEPPPQQVLHNYANWVARAAGERVLDGTITISRQCFFEDYLLPKLAIINRNITLEAIRADHEGYDLQEIKFHFELGKLFNEQSDPKSYQFNRTQNPFLWEFEMSRSKNSRPNETIMSKLLQIYGSLDCYVKNSVEIKPISNMSNRIMIKGEYKIHKVRNANFFNGGSYDYERDWWIDFILKSVEKGGLVVEVASGIGEPKQRKDHDNHLFAQDDDRHSAELSDIIRNALNIEDITKSMQDTLGGSWDFFFPGTGSFVLKHPNFSQGGNLTAELSYVGI